MTWKICTKESHSVGSTRATCDAWEAGAISLVAHPCPRIFLLPSIPSWSADWPSLPTPTPQVGNAQLLSLTPLGIERFNALCGQTGTATTIDAARPRRHLPGDQWFVDETYVKVAGRWVYLYRGLTQFGQVIDVLVSEKRDLAATRRFSPVPWSTAPDQAR